MEKITYKERILSNASWKDVSGKIYLEIGNSQGQNQTQKICIWWLRPFSRNNNKQNIITSYKPGMETSNILLYESSNMSIHGTNYMGMLGRCRVKPKLAQSIFEVSIINIKKSPPPLSQRGVQNTQKAHLDLHSFCAG